MNPMQAIEWIRFVMRNDGLPVDAAARQFSRQYPAAFADILDRIGSWPSSEPELAALQRVQ